MEKDNNTLPHLYKGGMASDVRGKVGFVNDFKFKKIKRFYIISNKKINYFRGWHGHKKEEKYVFVVQGKAKISAVEVDNWKNPSKNLKVHSYTLEGENPAILYIPKGYANGFVSLRSNTKVIFFSTCSLAQSKKDDIRFNETYWML